jgi:hypothetical protein
MQILPCYKSHYSLGKSILTLEKPAGNVESTPASIIDLVLHSKQNSLTLIEDNMTGYLEASKNCKDNKIKLIFGLRLSVTNDIENQDEASLKNRAKYVIFAKNGEEVEVPQEIVKSLDAQGWLTPKKSKLAPPPPPEAVIVTVTPLAEQVKFVEQLMRRKAG